MIMFNMITQVAVSVVTERVFMEVITKLEYQVIMDCQMKHQVQVCS